MSDHENGSDDETKRNSDNEKKKVRFRCPNTHFLITKPSHRKAFQLRVKESISDVRDEHRATTLRRYCARVCVCVLPTRKETYRLHAKIKIVFASSDEIRHVEIDVLLERNFSVVERRNRSGRQQLPFCVFRLHELDTLRSGFSTKQTNGGKPS